VVIMLDWLALSRMDMPPKVIQSETPGVVFSMAFSFWFTSLALTCEAAGGSCTDMTQ